MFVNSIIRRNKCPNRTRRGGLRHRFLLIIALVLLTGMLASRVILNTSAAKRVNVGLRIDLTDLSDEYLNSLYDNYNDASSYNITKPLFKLYSDFYDRDGRRVTSNSVFITKEFGKNGTVSPVTIEPGKYYIYNQLLVSTKEGRVMNFIDGGGYFKLADIDNREIEIQDGYPKNNSNSVIAATPIEILNDGSVVLDNGSDYVIKVQKSDYETNKPYVDVYLRSLNGAEIPKNEKLLLSLDSYTYTFTGNHEDDVVQHLGDAAINIDGLGKYRATFNNINIETPPLTVARNHTNRSYCISYAVVDNDNNVDPYWRNFDCRESYNWQNVYGYSTYNNSSLGNDINTIRYAKSGNSSRSLIFGENYIGVMNGINLYGLVIESAYTKVNTSNVYEVSEARSDEASSNSFHKIQSVNDIRDGAHYIIASKNYIDGNYYALSVNNNTNATLLPDLTDQNINDYRISDADVSKSDYVMTVRSSAIDGNMATAKFLSNISSDTGRKKTLKLGSDAWSDKRMFNDLGGAQFSIQEDQFEAGRFRIYKHTGDLVLNDIFGNPFFTSTTNPKSADETESVYKWFNLEYYLKRNQNNGDGSNNQFVNTFSRAYNYSTRYTFEQLYPEAYRSNDYIVSCARYISSKSNNIDSCNIDAENADYWNSEDYYNKWLETVSGSLYILTDAPIQNSTPQKQDVRVTYFPVSNIKTDYKETWGDYTHDGYSRNFILVYEDETGKNHILSSIEAVDGKEHQIYPGTDASLNRNGTITTYVGNAFTFSVDEDIKSESDSQLKLHGLRQYDEYTEVPYITIDSNDDGNYLSYSKSRKEMSFYFNDDNTAYLRASKSDRWIGWGEIEDKDGNKINGFVSVSTKDQAIKFNVYRANNQSYKIIYKDDYFGDHESYAYVSDWIPESGSTISRSQLTRLNNTLGKKFGKVLKDDNGVPYTYKELIFAGWTTNPEKAGLDSEPFENIYDGKNGLSEEFVDKHELVSNTDYADIGSLVTEEPEIHPCEWNPEYLCGDSPTITLYSVYIELPTLSYAIVKDGLGNNLLGATDWKDWQSGRGIENMAIDNDETWQGSINIEVYIDGQKQNDTQKIYYTYHNDNAADIILKFIDDEKLSTKCPDGMLPDNVPDYIDVETICTMYGTYTYMMDDSILPAKSQYGDYVIDAVIAEQAGSEDGLKYAYNWVNDSSARLDNVKGGSTIKVYMSNKYQVKYYLDDEELTDGDYQDINYYASNATANAIEAENAMWNLNNNISDEELEGLMNKTITEVGNSEVYKPADSKRFSFEGYKYIVHERDNRFTAAKAPTIPEGMKFVSAKWQIKDGNGNIVAEVSPEELAAISEQEGGLEEFFSALTHYAYKNDSDSVNTFHLHLYTEDGASGAVSETNPRNPFTSSGAIAIYFVIAGASIAGLGLFVYKKSR